MDGTDYFDWLCEMNFEKCGKPVKCYDYGVRPCVCNKGHKGGCNPFTNNPNIPEEQK